MIARSLLLAGLMCCSLLGFAQDGAGINWFEPLAAKTGDQVIISCRHFPGGDSTAVFFNGITAKILKNTPDHLVVIVPPGKAAGLITVSSPGIMLSSKQRFKLIGDAGIFAVSRTKPLAATTSTSKSLPAAPNEKTSLLPAATAKTTPDKSAAKYSSTPVAKPPLAVAVKAITPAPLKTTAPVPVKALPLTSKAIAIIPTKGLNTPPAKTVTPVLPTPATATKGTPITATTLAATVMTRSATEAPAAAPEEKSAHEKVKSVGKPLILGFSPRTGPPGTLVHISGLNFGFDKQEVTVSIRNTSLTVQSVYDQEIVVLIPADMTQSGSLVVVVSGRKISSRDQFRNN